MPSIAIRRLVRLLALLCLSVGIIAALLIFTVSLVAHLLPSHQLLVANHPGEFILHDFHSQRSVTLKFSDQDVPLDFRWSPDGRQILYMSINAGLYEVHLFDAFTRRTTRLDIDANNMLPSWSPDGQQLTYGSSTDGLCLLALATLSSTCIDPSTQTSNARYATWSPDGRWIAYYTLFPATLMVFDVQTQVASALIEPTTTVPAASLFWSPDSRNLYFQRNLVAESSTLMPGLPRTDLMQLDLSNAGQPIPSPMRVNINSGISFGYGWSPDGQQFAYTVDTRTLENNLAQRIAYDLVIYDRTTKSQRRITQDDAEELDPSWSPDGQWFAYIASLSGYPTLVLRDAGANYAVIDSSRISSYNIDWRP